MSPINPECVRHWNSRIGKHTGILPFTKNQVKA